MQAWIGKFICEFKMQKLGSNKQAMPAPGTYSQCRSVEVQTPVLQQLAGLFVVVHTVNKLLHCGQTLVGGAACVGTQVLPIP